MKPLLLASKSPRRKELLTQIRVPFIVQPGDGEEILAGDTPEEVVKNLALQKAAAALTGPELFLDYAAILGADTIVVCDGTILGKPKNAEDAAAMLRMLSGRTHSVYTGAALLYEDGRTLFAEETKVTMYEMTDAEIQWYIDTKEPMDKAGSYGIQGYGARFISGVEGDYNTVVGLPVGCIYQELKKHRIL